MIKSVKTKAKELLTHNANQCIEFLLENVKNNVSAHNDLIILKFNLKRVQESEIRQLQSRDSLSLELNKIVNSVLLLIEEIQEDDLAGVVQEDVFRVTNVDVKIYKNKITNDYPFIVRERFKTNSKVKEKLLKVQVRAENPEVNLLDRIDEDGYHVFDYYSMDNLFITRKIVLIQMNGTSSGAIDFSPIIQMKLVEDGELPPAFSIID